MLAPTGGGAACGSDTCQDIGTVTCCAGVDVCDNGGDDDCDGLVDEGCECGGVRCDRSIADCCDGDRCAIHSQHTDVCVGIFDAPTLSQECPEELIPSPFEDGATLARVGCCLEGVCGLAEPSWGCVPRERMHELYPMPAPLAAMSCTSP